jgi:CRP-like cAMP-binding protein
MTNVLKLSMEALTHAIREGQMPDGRNIESDAHLDALAEALDALTPRELDALVEATGGAATARTIANRLSEQVGFGKKPVRADPVMSPTPVAVRRPTVIINSAPSLYHRNAALAVLSPWAFSLLEPHLRYRDFHEGSVLWDAGAPTERVYFPLSGIISVLLPMKDGSSLEVASVGREAVAGLGYPLGQFRSVTRGITLISGTLSYISASQFAAAARQNEEIARFASIWSEWLLAQSQQIAACNAVHPANARFCRWLLQVADRLEGEVIPSTQETVAHALGIRLSTVTVIAQCLQMEGIISYRRGKIRIRDREGLRNAACSCCDELGRARWPAERLKPSEEWINEDCGHNPTDIHIIGDSSIADHELGNREWQKMIAKSVYYSPPAELCDSATSH